jgi:glycosyltransferase involved in cell wall biosynthesis
MSVSNKLQLPLVTVISVSYNSGFVMNETIDSILNLNYPNLELIIVDNLSTDNTREIVQRYGDKINLFVSEADEGPYDAMNKGIKQASGEWIWFMNMGDKIPKHANLLNEIFEDDRAQGVSVIYGNTRIVGRNNPFSFYYSPVIKENFKFGILTLNHQSLLCKKSLFLEFGLFDDKRFKIKADAYWLTKIANHLNENQFKHVNCIMAEYDDSGISGSTRNFSKMFREDQIIVKEFGSNRDYILLYSNQIILRFRLALLWVLQKNKWVYAYYRKIKYAHVKP